MSEHDERSLRHFDWIPRPGMSEKDKQKTRMLLALQDACKDCIMCRLGMQDHFHNGNKIENPHVFSTIRPSKFFVVGQNPGHTECARDEPFVGQAGLNFNQEIAKHGLTRKDFYITNAVKCHTNENKAPSLDEVEACEPFLKMEIQLLRPTFIIALGKTAFELLCPKLNFSDSFGDLVESKFGPKVYPIYHPSPLNFEGPGRRAEFERGIAKLCALVKHLSHSP